MPDAPGQPPSQPGRPQRPDSLPPAPVPPSPSLPPAARPAPAAAPRPAPAAAQPAPAAAPPKPAPVAPGVGELFEQSLTAFANPGVFRAAAARPAPTFVTATLFAVLSGAVSLAVNFAHGAVENSHFLDKFPPVMIAAVGVAALGLYASVMLLLAVMLYGLGNALGGKGEFDRGLQAAAMLSVLWPLQMACNWFPYAWIVPSALAAWLAACALEGLFGSSRLAARALCAVFGAGAIGLQAIGHFLVDRAKDQLGAVQALSGAAQAAGQAADANAELQRQIQAIQMQAAAGANTQGLVPGAPPTQATSGLDLLRPSGDVADALPQAPQQTPEQAAMQTAAGLQANAIGMLDSLAPLLNNPALTKNMTPEQKANMQELRALMADLKGQMAAGKRLSDADFAKKMQRYQQLSMRVMAAAAASQAAGAAAAPQAPAQPAAPKPRLKFSEDGK